MKVVGLSKPLGVPCCLVSMFQDDQAGCGLAPARSESQEAAKTTVMLPEAFSEGGKSRHLQAPLLSPGLTVECLAHVLALEKCLSLGNSSDTFRLQFLISSVT